MYPGVDPERSNAARVYDYLLGGTHNFSVDQDAARTLIAIAPEMPNVAKANRAFLGRAVRSLADAGIRQFLGRHLLGLRRGRPQAVNGLGRSGVATGYAFGRAADTESGHV